MVKVSGFVHSSVDVPGKWSLVLFLPYCNFRCLHCYNWRVVLDMVEPVNLKKVLDEVRNSPFLECVVISGGEPTVHSLDDLLHLVEDIKRANPYVQVRIDTNGSRPYMIKRLKKHVDGFAIDIKAPLDSEEKWKYVTGVDVNPKSIMESIFEADGMPLTLYRTVKYPWLEEEDLEKIRVFTSSLKSPWHINPFLWVEDCPFNEHNHACSNDI
ncbi:radical SAM protein [Thermocrinis sp.]